MAERDRIRQQEREEKLAQELKEIERCRQIALDEERQKQEKKEKHKLMIDMVVTEVEKAKALKAEELKKQRDEEHRIMKQYEYVNIYL